MTSAFQSINQGYNSSFRPNHLSLGVVVPLEYYPCRTKPAIQPGRYRNNFKTFG